MESAGARMLWITRSISCKNGEKFAGHEAREKEREQKSFAVLFACSDVRIHVTVVTAFYAYYVKIDFINSR